MRPWLRIVITALLLAAAGAAAWVYVHHRRLADQWEGQLGSYRVGQAETFPEAAAEIAALEQGPDRDRRLRELTGKWGTGNQRFDLYLAQYVRSAQSSERLRQTFSLELTWRKPLLERWAHIWRWQSPDEPDRRIASIVEYLDVLAAAEPPEEITWREVLDLQAVLALMGQPELAVRLKPENWRDRYRTWQKTRPARLPHVPRPAAPLPEGIGQAASLPAGGDGASWQRALRTTPAGTAVLAIPAGRGWLKQTASCGLRADRLRAAGQEVARPARGVIGIGDDAAGRDFVDRGAAGAATQTAAPAATGFARRRAVAVITAVDALAGSRAVLATAKHRTPKAAQRSGVAADDAQQQAGPQEHEQCTFHIGGFLSRDVGVLWVVASIRHIGATMGGVQKIGRTGSVLKTGITGAAWQTTRGKGKHGDLVSLLWVRVAA